MPWTSPRTWVAAELVTAALFNTHIRDNLNALREGSWPIGALFISVVSTNPATLLGIGTWVAIATGRMLVGIDAGQAEFDTVRETGGSKTHALTIAELPAHVHTVGAGLGTAGSGGTQNNIAADGTPLNTSSVGSGTAHNNLPPYYTCYMWERTA